MDDDSDVDKDFDNSLLDLHHGLDSSAEENRPEDTMGDQDAASYPNTEPVDIPARHVNMMEEMVQEMRHGLQAAVEELAKLQDRDEGAKVREFQQQQQRQLDDLTESVHGMKSQMDTMTKYIETIQKENRLMKDNFAALHKYIKDMKGDEHLSLSQLEWTDEATENPFEGENGEDQSPFRDSSANDEVTAVACKSLSLTQALGEKCLHLNLSLSSEEGEEPETRRLSHYTPSSTTQQQEKADRRHSMPASTTPRSNGNDHVANAAQRRKAVKELTDSECDYCSQLWTLVETYFTSLQGSAFLPSDQLEVLFPSYLEKLYEQHCMMYSSLQDKLVHWSYLTVVSDLLSCITDSHNPYSLLSLYREYSENLPDAISCLKSALAHSTEFKAFLKTIQQSSCQNEDLMSLIKAPAQHLPKYLLQLQQICKYTPSTHPDYLLLRTSLSRLRLFVEQMNVGINKAMHATSKESGTGSSNDSSQVLSARDSGNQSNEEELVSARTFFQSEQCLASGEWPEEPFCNVQHHQLTPPTFYGRHARVGLPSSLSSNYNTLSHPDLTLINNSSMPNSASQYSLPPSGLGRGWRNGMDGAGPGGRQNNRLKHQMKRMHVQPDSLLQDPNHHLARTRPASAIDFIGSYNHVNPLHHLPAANYPRPRSVMGPMEPHHRPAIISRKHMRRSQPPLSNSGYWADVDSQPSKLAHPKMGISSHEILPSRPSPMHIYNSQEDDEEDDTRASDSFSLMTNSSHHQSSSHSSKNGRETELDFDPLASETLPHIADGGQQFSEDDVAERLAQKLLFDDSDTKEITKNGDVPNGDRILQKEDIHSNTFEKANTFTDMDKKEKKSLLSKQLSSNTFPSTGEQVSQIPSSANNSNSVVKYTKDSAHGFSSKQSTNQFSIQEGVGEKLETENKQTARKSWSPKNNEGKARHEKNRQFLLSLTHSPRSKKSSESASSIKDSELHQEVSLEVSSSSASGNKPIAVSTDRVILSQNSRPKIVRRSAPSLVTSLQNGSQHHGNHESTTVSSSNSYTANSSASDHDSSVTSAASKGSANKLLSSTISSKSHSNNVESGIDGGDSRDHLMTRSLDLSEVHKSVESIDHTQDHRKKIKNGDTSNGFKASDDPFAARKKMHLKSSIKNLFSKKRGKVILADVEKEVILEMASAAISGSTNTASVRNVTSPLCDKDNQEKEIPNIIVDSVVSESHPVILSGAQDQQDSSHQKQNFPVAFEMRWKTDKGSSTSSPMKSTKQINATPTSENQRKPFSILSNHPAQSPCAYQEKLLKERLDAQGNSQLEQKPLIHPKFLSTKPSKDPVSTTVSHSAVSGYSGPIDTVKACAGVSINPLPPLLMMKQRNLQEDSCDLLAKKSSKTKQKGQNHMKKHFLSYESQESEKKDRDDVKKKIQDKSKAKCLRHKEECPKCQNKSSNGMKEQPGGKSFHIQAYKAYRNKNRDHPTTDRRDPKNLHQGEEVAYIPHKVSPADLLPPSSLDCLKPCEEAITYYETSRNPKMIASYPLVSDDYRTKRKNCPIKDLNKGPVMNHSAQQASSASLMPYNASATSDSRKQTRNVEKHLMPFLSGAPGAPGAPMDSDYCLLKNISRPASYSSPTNDLSNPMSNPIQSDQRNNVLSDAYPYYFNLPAPQAISPAKPITSSSLNQNSNYLSMVSGNGSNLLRMSREQFFNYSRDSIFAKESRDKASNDLDREFKHNISLESINNENPLLAGASYIAPSLIIKSEDSKQLCSKRESNDTEEGLEDGKSCLKEEKDYFDYKYRLCYVDGTKFEADLNQCNSCSPQEKDDKNEKSVETNDSLLNRYPGNKKTSACEAACKADKKCQSFNTEKEFKIDQLLRPEIERGRKSSPNFKTSYPNTLFSRAPQKNASNSLAHQPEQNFVVAGDSKLFQPRLVLSTSKSDFSCNPANKSFMSASTCNSKIENISIQSSSHIVEDDKHLKYSSHLKASSQPSDKSKNGFRLRNVTSETFSGSLSQPIFSVLPFEGYSMNCQDTLKTDNPSVNKPVEYQNASMMADTTTRSHDITRRTMKENTKTHEHSRNSSSSVQSANEIHIFKLNDLSSDASAAATDLENQITSASAKDNFTPNKAVDTLQVRYIPKSNGPLRQNKVQTTAHAQLSKNPSCVNGTATSPSTSFGHQSGRNVPYGAASGMNSPIDPPPEYSNDPQTLPTAHGQSGLCASALSGPDLLQVSVIQPGTSPKSEASRSGLTFQSKKQSFFSRLAHSPLSFFSKDAKNNGQK